MQNAYPLNIEKIFFVILDMRYYLDIYAFDRVYKFRVERKL